MKGLSILITLHGLVYFVESIFGLYGGEELRFGRHLINSNYYLVGIILGAWLIVNGTGIWYRKRYAYGSTILAYSLLIIYGIFGVGYLILNEPIESGIIAPIVIIVIISLLFFIIIRYIQKNKSEFK